MDDHRFEIRSAGMADYRHLVPLMEADLVMHHAALPKLFKMGRYANYDEKKFKSLIDGPESSVYVATRNKSILGLAAVMVREVPESLVAYPQRYAEIDYVSVKKSVRRQGIGRALVKTCIEWGLEHEIDRMALNVFSFNTPALGFYRAMGFSTTYHRMNLKIGNDDPASS